MKQQKKVEYNQTHWQERIYDGKKGEYYKELHRPARLSLGGTLFLNLRAGNGEVRK
jgi:hypothetical protein